MPIIIPPGLPAFKILKKENIVLADREKIISQKIRPIEIAILNLMPTKIETETQLIRLLSGTPLHVNITLLKTATYKSKNVPQGHLDNFYVAFRDIESRKIDGLIITGAPVENMRFEQVEYWSELKKIMEHTKTNGISTVFICWGAQAGLYFHFGIDKVFLTKKLSGVFAHEAMRAGEPLLNGLDDVFYIPHSRFTGLNEQAVKSCSDLEVLAYGRISKSSILKSKDNKMFFFTGHSEYDRNTLDSEYMRDIDRGLNPKKPTGYYRRNKPYLRWKSTATLVFGNWLSYYVCNQSSENNAAEL